jgi:hypothetical protein
MNYRIEVFNGGWRTVYPYVPWIEVRRYLRIIETWDSGAVYRALPNAPTTYVAR